MARRVDSELLLVGSLPADSTESALRSAAPTARCGSSTATDRC